MRFFSFLLLAVAAVILGSFTPTPPALHAGSLFRIPLADRQGFIDSIGRVVIAPAFRSADDFSEGLASARMEGRYGYLDATGRFVIPAQFDYATPFQEGLALVYRDGRPLYVNHQGQAAFACPFSIAQPFRHGCAVVGTVSGKLGLIDRRGRLFVDTAYDRIGDFIDGLAVVHRLKQPAAAGQRPGSEPGVIDSLGHVVVPYGKYVSIDELEAGYFRAESAAEPWDTVAGYSARTVLLTRAGQPVLSRDHRNNIRINGVLRCGLVKMSLYKYWIPEAPQVFWTSKKSYEGYADAKGEIVINDTTYAAVGNFADNRAFVLHADRQYSLINRRGKFIAHKAFDQISGEGFRNGVAFVEVDDKWGLIDTNAHFLVKPSFDGIDDVGMVGNYFFFTAPDPDDKNEDGQLIGIARRDGSVVLPPVMSAFDQRGFRGGLLACYIKHQLTYVNPAGRTVWQQSAAAPRLTALHIDYMNRGYFYAYSSATGHSGGWAESGNVPRKVPKKNRFAADKLSAWVDTLTSRPYVKRYHGLAVYVANNSSAPVTFNAQDSRLDIKAQALNKAGQWQDIEYLPSSWCGNSYHTVELPPKSYWRFVMPRYAGDFRTKLRLALTYAAPAVSKEMVAGAEKQEIVFYSNVFDGSINPGQLWRKPGYSSGSLMDPYND